VTEMDPVWSARGEGHSRRSKTHAVRVFARDIIFIFVAAIMVSVGIRTFLIRAFYIPSGSMMNTLQINDRILVNELVLTVVPVQHGVVVVFTDPGGWSVSR
jgi:signal peptidase I